MGISFANFIHSELPARANSRDAVISSLRSETRPIPEIDSENDLIAFVASHPDVSIPPYGAISCLYSDWREYQFQQEKRGGAE
ncbi:hypothetical protein AA18889_1344 [Acetobacter senegalensis DSM 18889]|nr:hypothetical protein AA18889_1344 [Acetobacter senegalensis DSM 18889]